MNRPDPPVTARSRADRLIIPIVVYSSGVESRLPTRRTTRTRCASAKGTSRPLQRSGEASGDRTSARLSHTSAVQGASQLRELRPRAGRSPWRGLYHPVGNRFVIAAIAPEAQHYPKGFMRACGAAAKRLSELEE
jgi:hypothetical protein